MQELELTWRRIASIWWRILWRSAGFIGGFIAALLGHADMSRTVGLWVGRAVALPWLLAVIKMAIDKRYRGFRIALLSA